MTRIMTEHKDCAACGRMNTVTRVLSIYAPHGIPRGSNRFGLRSRATLMNFNCIETCKFCGYSNSLLDKFNIRKVNLIKSSEKYQSVLNNSQLNPDFKEQYLSALISEEMKYFRGAAYKYAVASSYTDDEEQKKDAIHKAIELYEKPPISRENLQDRLIFIDFCRRNNDFEKCKEMAEKEIEKVKNIDAREILKTEINLCNKKESGDYFDNLFVRFICKTR